jgi:hypothetical protein
MTWPPLSNGLSEGELPIDVRVVYASVPQKF